ncbi:MAG TPA: hypothetical protein VFW89_04140 [Gemmatimonadaceae bacterium]|nr:hypothetical protein [Gemmatimonadaceae bacterium]
MVTVPESGAFTAYKRMYGLVWLPASFTGSLDLSSLDLRAQASRYAVVVAKITVPADALRCTTREGYADGWSSGILPNPDPGVGRSSSVTIEGIRTAAGQDVTTAFANFYRKQVYTVGDTVSSRLLPSCQSDPASAPLAFEADGAVHGPGIYFYLDERQAWYFRDGPVFS